VGIYGLAALYLRSFGGRNRRVRVSVYFYYSCNVNFDWQWASLRLITRFKSVK